GPGTGNRQCPRRTEQVNEQRAPVRREAGACKLGLEAAQRQPISIAGRGYAPQVIADRLGILVLAHEQVSVGGDDEIVAEIELVAALALEEQLQPVTAAAGPQAEYLADLRCTAAGAAEIHLAFAHPHPLSAGKR